MADTSMDFDHDLVVGTDEKHHVEYHWSQMWGDTRILVDGVEVLKKRKYFTPFGKGWRYEISIGDREVHRFAVEQSLPALLGGYRKHTFRFFVDDALVWTNLPDHDNQP